MAISTESLARIRATPAGQQSNSQLGAAASSQASQETKPAEVADIEESDLWHLVEQNIRLRMEQKEW